eukprot:4349149-Ditylum_brightwellii.AAC.1
MDAAAKVRQDSDERQPAPIQYTIDGEMWCLYTYCEGKGMESSNPQEVKVTMKAEDGLNRTIKGSKLLNYWKEHFTFNPGTSKEIDWKAIGI